jgi:hypothetical protein
MTTSVSAPRLIIVLGILVSAVFLQGSSQLSWFGIRPNISLSILTALAFMFSDFFVYAALVFITAAFVGPAPGFSFEELIFVLVLCALFFVRDRLSIRPLFAAVLLVVCGTFIFYLVVDPGFIAADFIAVLIEMFYNTLITLIFYMVFKRIFSHGKTSLTAF